MSERGQGQQGKGQGQPGQGQQGQTYVVRTDFTDDKGHTWTAGTAFSGDEAAVRKALVSGQIEEGKPEAKPKT